MLNFFIIVYVLDLYTIRLYVYDSNKLNLIVCGAVTMHVSLNAIENVTVKTVIYINLDDNM